MNKALNEFSESHTSKSRSQDNSKLFILEVGKHKHETTATLQSRRGLYDVVFE